MCGNIVPSEKALFGGNQKKILWARLTFHTAWLHLAGENNRADWPPKNSYHHYRCPNSCSCGGAARTLTQVSEM